MSKSEEVKKSGKLHPGPEMKLLKIRETGIGVLIRKAKTCLG
jgi:hypothetical protein